MVVWSIPAKNDLKNIYDYIARDSRYYADRVTEDIVIESERLLRFPKLGRLVSEVEDVNIRELIVYSFRLIYKVTSKRIEILALVHVKRDFR